MFISWAIWRISKGLENEFESAKINRPSMFVSLTLSMLGKKFSRRHFEIFVLFSPENRIRHFMQSISLGANLHEMSKPIFLKKKTTKKQQKQQQQQKKITFFFNGAAGSKIIGGKPKMCRSRYILAYLTIFLTVGVTGWVGNLWYKRTI